MKTELQSERTRMSKPLEWAQRNSLAEAGGKSAPSLRRVPRMWSREIPRRAISAKTCPTSATVLSSVRYHYATLRHPGECLSGKRHLGERDFGKRHFVENCVGLFSTSDMHEFRIYFEESNTQGSNSQKWNWVRPLQIWRGQTRQREPVGVPIAPKVYVVEDVVTCCHGTTWETLTTIKRTLLEALYTRPTAASRPQE